MKKLLIAITTLAFGFANFSQSQTLFRKNYKYGGLAAMGIPASVVEGINPNTYVLAGTQVSFSIPLLSGIISKLDANGGVVWSYKYSDNSLAFNLNDIKKDATKKEYYLVGGSDDGNAVFLVVDDNGNLVIDTKFSVNTAEGTIFNRVQKTTDGGYIVVGAVSNGNPDGSGPEPKFNNHAYTDENGNPGGGTEAIYSPLIVKLNASGIEVWHKVFRFYKSGTKTPANVIHNTGEFYGVVETTDGYVAVGSYKVNDWVDANNGNGDETATDAIILKTTKSGSINYFEQIDNPNTSASQNSKSLADVGLTSAGDILAAGLDDGKALIQKYNGSGGFSNTVSRNWDYGGFFVPNTATPSQIYEIPGSTDLAVMSMYIEFGLPPTFANIIHRMNATATTSVWNKEYDFSLGAILPRGSITADKGYVLLSMALSAGYQVIRTDKNGDIGSSACPVSTLSPSSGGGPGTFSTPYYNHWSPAFTSGNADVLRTNFTPSVTEKCIKIQCTPPAAPNKVTANDICAGETSTIEASGTATDVTYHVYTAATGGTDLGTAPLSVTPSTTTSYYVETVRNSDPTCISTSRVKVTVTVNPVITVNIINPINIKCNGGSTGSATAQVTGGTSPYNYSWSPSGGASATSSPLTAGTYKVIITDDANCQDSASVTLTEPLVIAITTQNKVDATCGKSNGSIKVAASGGTGTLSYQWGPKASNQTGPTASGLAGNDSYIVTVTDDNGCSKQKTIPISGASAPSVNIINPINIKCNGGSTGSATAQVTGGTSPYNYSWSPSGGASATSSPLAAGTYKVIITDDAGCQDSASVTLTEPLVIAIATQNKVDATCGKSNGSVKVAASGGTGTLSYQWGPKANNQTGPTASGLAGNDSYIVTVTDDNGCSKQKTISISGASAPSVSIINAINIKCNGDTTGSATAQVTGGTSSYKYSWSPSGGASATSSPLAAGTYKVIITDDAGCQDSATVTLTESDSIKLSTSITKATCGNADGSATVTVISGGTSPYTYQWDDPNNQTSATASNIAAKTYNVTVTDKNGCTAETTAEVVNADGPSISIDSVQNASCNGGNDGSAFVSVTGGKKPYTYLWSPTGGASSTASNLEAGQYTIKVTDKDGCTATEFVTITAPKALNAKGTIVPTECGKENGSIAINTTGGTPGYFYVWSNGGTTSSITDIYGGKYTVTITDKNGCTLDTSFTVGATGGLIVNAQPDVSTIHSDEIVGITVSAGGNQGNYTYSWTPTKGLSCTDCPNPQAGPNLTTTYIVTVTDTATGCVGMDTVLIKIENLCGEIFVPNMFSPNHDGLNDKFCVEGNCIKEFRLEVYERWGNKVFESNDISKCWDGRYKGKKMNTAIFVYKLHVVTKEGKVIDKSGNVNLVR